MGSIIGGILTGIIAVCIISFSLGRINRILAVLSEISGAGVVVYFGFIRKQIPMDFSIACLASYLVASFVLGWVLAALDD
jgi:hypothetical protein